MILSLYLRAIFLVLQYELMTTVGLPTLWLCDPLTCSKSIDVKSVQQDVDDDILVHPDMESFTRASQRRGGW